ncbi:MAG: glycosyltransferase [Lachnospiraceae bacterium]|nr:glycosyltransferase [Lachnospiraceae bacterium]
MLLKFSIITVCLNAADRICDTVRSVAIQDYPDIEYIVVDGSSKDSTLEVLEGVLKECGKNVSSKVISEPDDGLYDAMNKGIAASSGDIIYFLNAGDELYDGWTISRVAAGFLGETGSGGKKTAENRDIVYGNIIYRYPDGSEQLRRYGRMCGSRLYYITGDCINHQALFARRECFEGKAFDTGLKICADREWMMRMHEVSKRFSCLDITVCRYRLDGEGVSEKNPELYWKEAEHCIRLHMPHSLWAYRIFNTLRNNKFTSKLLHGLYKALFIHNTQTP